MKKFTILATMVATFLVACNSKSTKTTEQSEAGQETVYTCSMHPEIIGKQGDKCPKCGMSLTEAKDKTAVSTTTITNETTTKTQTRDTAIIKELLNNYLLLKNALAADKTNEAASAGKTLEASFKSFDKNTLTPEQKKAYEAVEEDAREHAEHIGANGGKIDHQREHFDMLSIDMYDLVKVFGSDQVLYKDFCPMYNKGKGAIWLSETKEIKNPYYGKKMLTCGVLKEDIK